MTDFSGTGVLWLLTTVVADAGAEPFSDVLGEEAVALTELEAPGGKKIEALFADKPDLSILTTRCALLAAAVGCAVPVLSLHSAPQKDWLRYVAQGVPLQNIARWVVGDSDHRAALPAGRYRVALDAATAFGSGAHPTTAGCLVLLDRALKRGFRPERVADIGCGSGILALACVRATKAVAVCVDNDKRAVCAARQNVRVNGLGGRLFVCYGSGYAPPLVRAMAPYDAIMANIFSSPLCALARDAAANLRYGGMAFLSGILTSQAHNVIAAHRLQGLSLFAQVERDGWAALAFRRLKRA